MRFIAEAMENIAPAVDAGVKKGEFTGTLDVHDSVIYPVVGELKKRGFGIYHIDEECGGVTITFSWYPPVFRWWRRGKS